MDPTPALLDAHRKPLLLKRNRVWRTYTGGRLLEQWQGIGNGGDGSHPEEWIGSTVRTLRGAAQGTAEGLSAVDGKQLGQSGDILLPDLIEAAPRAMLGDAHVDALGAQMGILVKALDAAERLTIQVHPTKAQARHAFGSDFGKTEAWYVLATRGRSCGEEPCVYLGFCEHVTKAHWKGLFESQDALAMRRALHRFPVSPGDVFLVEGGVPHAIGEGCFLLELQEPTDFTFRAERTTPRGQLLPDEACHLGLGFDAMLDMHRYEPLTRQEVLRRWKIEPRPLQEGASYRLSSLLDASHTDCFSMQRLDLHGEYAQPPRDSFAIAIVAAGSGTIATDAERLQAKQGDSFFLPARVSPLCWQGDMNVLFCLPPGV